ncbi:hypothetical protein D3C81_1734610 [compost metagenome]
MAAGGKHDQRIPGHVEPVQQDILGQAEAQHGQHVEQQAVHGVGGKDQPGNLAQLAGAFGVDEQGQQGGARQQQAHAVHHGRIHASTRQAGFEGRIEIHKRSWPCPAW